jgi:hypothetical protein
MVTDVRLSDPILMSAVLGIREYVDKWEDEEEGRQKLQQSWR